MQLVDINDKGVASGTDNTDPFAKPLSVSPTTVHVANAENFYGDAGMAWRTYVGGSNNSGVIAGQSTVDATAEAFGWTWNGAALTRLKLPTDFAARWAGVVGIDDAGNVAATFAAQGSSITQVGISTPTSVTVMPLIFNDATETAVAHRISKSGLVAGLAWNGTGQHPFIWKPGQTPRLLAVGRTNCPCSIEAVNDNGQVVLSEQEAIPTGSGLNYRSPNKGFIATVDSRTDLPMVKDASTRYTGINNNGDLVGIGADGPFLFRGGKFYLLNEWAKVDGWVYDMPTYINNVGQIIGQGTFQGQRRWYRMTIK